MTTKKQQKPSAPIIAKGNEKAVFEKLVRAATSYDQAWQFIHKTFPRAKYGKVRDVVQNSPSQRRSARRSTRSTTRRRSAAPSLS